MAKQATVSQTDFSSLSSLWVLMTENSQSIRARLIGGKIMLPSQSFPTQYIIESDDVEYLVNLMSNAMPLIAPTPHRLTINDYHRMGEIGIIQEDSRIELIEGELIDMAPIGSLHAAAVNDVAEQFIREKPSEIIVSIQNPIILGDDSEPQPDVAILRPRADRYRSELPTAEDALLLIEIADSSLHYDRNRKIPLYARHSIAEVWIFDLASQTLERYYDPDPETATYRTQERQQQGIAKPQRLAELEIDLSVIW